MKLNEFDSTILVAKQTCGYALYLVRYGKHWRYVVNDLLSLNDFNTVGNIYENKTDYVTRAYDYARSLGFSNSEILDKYPRKLFVELSSDEITALHIAKRLILNNTNSDQGEQCYIYLNKIIDKLK
ncbi:hypothetical protein [Haliea sp.]|uniref:hypothetical protein n=1 Tax=Haliea sp. TaxID=1932666 RepID=UPI0025BCE7D2|nr:hypothetical protein [Haliea sp.]|tara:strand:+ start:461 stop:838 length:378 start_codon:yes stop_codon:yes gene_type:complete